jgi:hypothetical protein
MDLVITPIYAVFIFIVANNYRNNSMGSSPLRMFFIPGLMYKLAGSIASALVYQYYYQGGDTFNFYTSSSYIHGITVDNLEDALLLQTDLPMYQYPQLWIHQPYLDFVNDSSSWFVVRVITLFGYLTFDSYMGIGLLFAIFSFIASWQFFKLICELYPSLKQQFFYCVFLIPSVVFWGSGVFKDTLTLSGLLLFLVGTYYLVIKRKNWLRSFIILFVGYTIVYSIRKFFIVLIIPSFALWYFVSIRDAIRNELLKLVLLPMLVVLALFFIAFGLSRLTEGSGELSRQALTEKSKGFQSYHTELGGSAYSLGDIDYTNVGIMKKMPEAINVTLFRPYLTEIHSFFQLISALQSLFFLLFTLRTIVRARVFGFFSILLGDSLALFSFFFSLFYAFVAGFTSFNFGALDRYKIPCLPFYMIALILVNYKSSGGNVQIVQRKLSAAKTTKDLSISVR